MPSALRSVPRGAWLRRGPLLLLAPALFLALYARALDYGFAWMDHSEIEQGEILVPPGSLWTAFARPLHERRVAGFEQLRNPYYRPLQIALASAIHHRVGAVPRYYRAVSLAIGAATALAFGLLVHAWLGSFGAAAFAACFAALHPAGIEAYVWISGMSEALGALFVMASLGLAWAALYAPAAGRRAALGALSLAALAAALLAKEKAVAVPGLLLAACVGAAVGEGWISRAPGRAGRPERLRAALALLGLQIVLVAGYALVWRPLMLGSIAASAEPIGGALGSHLASALATWPGNLLWLFLPLHSTTSDVVRVVPGFLDPMPWLGLALAALSLGGWLWLLRRRHLTAALGLAWIWIAFLPTANLVPQIHADAERYLHLSSFGAALLLAAALARALASPSRARALGAAALAIAMVAFVAQRSWQRTPDWRSTGTLFERDVAGSPAFREGRLHLAEALFREGRHDEAERHLRVLLDEPAEFAGLSSYVSRIGAYELACQVRLARRRPADAASLVRELGARDARLAALPSLRTCLARAYEGLGRREEALRIYLAVAEDLEEETPAALSLLIARSLAQLGRGEEARAWLGRAEAAPGRSPRLEFELDRLRRLLRR